MDLSGFMLDGYGNISMSLASLVAVAILGGTFYGEFQELKEHLELDMHPRTQEILEAQGKQLDTVMIILIRGEIASYVSRICNRSGSPNVRSWQSELNRLLTQYEALTNTPYDAALLECE